MAERPENYDWSILARMKEEGRKITSLALYDSQTAKMAAPHLDFILVGDSVAMTVHGHKTTRAATMQMMLLHGCDVVAGAGETPVIVDMPECSYHNVDDAMKAARLIRERTKCAALKLEGGEEKAEIIRRIVQDGHPVMGHIGLMPSHFGEDDKYVISGRGQEKADQLIQDAWAVQNAGAFAIVIEGSVEPVSSYLAKELSIPTIGIGASPDCSGQILVLPDVLGHKTDALARPPKFARCFREKGMTDAQAVAAYSAAVRDGTFPDREQHCFPVRPQDGEIVLYGRGNPLGCGR